MSQTIGQVPLSFEANHGQADPQVKFLSRGGGQTLFLTATEAVFALRKADVGLRNESKLRDTRGRLMSDNKSALRCSFEKPQSTIGNEQSAVLRMSLLGANAAPRVRGEDELPGKVNYFTGRDPAKWRAGVSTYERIMYEGVYPGINLLYYGNRQQLEYDFIVAPGADPRTIRLQFHGAKRIELDTQGDLILHTAVGEVRQHRPVIYQSVGGARREVAGRYLLKKNYEVSFQIGEYDTTQPLVIDPVIAYATYFIDMSDIAVDNAGSIYVTGGTEEINLPIASAQQGSIGGLIDAFVTKFNPAGTQLVYSTYLGGGGWDRSNAIAIDTEGSAYLTGVNSGTIPNDFPIRNALQPQPGGGPSDGFVAKLNPAGLLVYSSFLGGSEGDGGDDITVDVMGNAYVTGSTFSINFPTRNAVQPVMRGHGDFFVAKLNAAGSALDYSTYLGGADLEAGAPGIAIDGAGSAYITGYSYSTDFPTVNALQPARRGDPAEFESDAVVAKLSPTGSALLYSTYLGGEDSDIALDIAVDPMGNAYITGLTNSTDFPTQNPLQPSRRGIIDAFVAKLNATGSALVYSTYLGGNDGPCRPDPNGGIVICGGDEGVAIAADRDGNAYVTGGTPSTDFPLLNPFQSTMLGGDAFLTKFNPTGSILFSTYLGGTRGEAGTSIALDGAGKVYIAGPSNSFDFPTVNAFHAMPLFHLFGFIAKITDAAPNEMRFSQATYNAAEGSGPASLTVTRSGDTSTAATVEYTAGSVASTRCDAVTGNALVKCDLSASTSGTLSFAPGETSKAFRVFITDDAFAEGTETIGFTLHNLTGSAALAAPASVVLTIADNDTATQTRNSIDDPAFFVRQHYLDFLNREPEPEGLAAWLRALNGCREGDASCDRVQVSSAFFRSLEFQQFKGYFVIRFYTTALARLPRYAEFLRDLEQVTSATPEEVAAAQAAFANEFIGRTDFRERYDRLSPRDYVTRLLQTAEIELTSREQLISDLESGRKTRARVLRDIVESREVYDVHFNAGFVTMQFFGYLRRDPERSGYLAWLDFLNRNPQDYRTMVNGFLNSAEYRLRFGQP
ncbi:MAG: SBBP repeat-containing protein [Pyrinomonadaceae bacterium]